MFKYRIIDDEIIITGVKDQLVKSIDISEFIGDLPVTGIAMDSYHRISKLKYITIPKSVLNIHRDAFRYLKYIQTYTLSL